MSRFEKVSFRVFAKAMLDLGYTIKEEVDSAYDSVNLPVRGTIGAAGYDFCSPISVDLKPNSAVTLPTGVRWIGDKNTFLSIVPRSGLGFKYQVGLANTVGVIDWDYCLSDNEGHIMIKLVNHSVEDKTLVIERGDRVAQGIIMPFLTTEDDCVTTTRNGGFGSTGR